MCMPLSAEKRGLPVSPLFGEGVRCSDRLRHLRTDDCELSPFGEKLSPFVPCETVYGRVRLFLSLICIIPAGQTLTFDLELYRMSITEGETPSKKCHGCSTPFKDPSASIIGAGNATEGMSPFGRYKCPTCQNDFCTDCDVFVHDVVHCCPGCGK